MTKIYHKNIIPFSELERHIVGWIDEYCESIKFVIYSNHAPAEKDIIAKNNKKYLVLSVTDVTNDEEFEQGLSYSKVELSKL